MKMLSTYEVISQLALIKQSIPPTTQFIRVCNNRRRIDLWESLYTQKPHEPDGPVSYPRDEWQGRLRPRGKWRGRGHIGLQFHSTVPYLLPILPEAPDLTLRPHVLRGMPDSAEGQDVPGVAHQVPPEEQARGRGDPPLSGPGVPVLHEADEPDPLGSA